MFEEFDRQVTPMGEISVRRRLDPILRSDVYEVKLGDEHLISNVFTAAEIALADLALAELHGTDLDVVVGGLGLGYTARAALADERVRSVDVVEALPAVIDWHQRRILPDAEGPDRYDAILLDIDHTPTHLLGPSHAAFYTPAGLVRVAERLRPRGVLGLWSDCEDLSSGLPVVVGC